MKCPACKETLIILELHEVEVDYCTNCLGIWLDQGELEMMFDHEDEVKKLVKSFQNVIPISEKKLKCPVCNERMNKAKHNDTGIITDRCINNHGYWFDKGELETILSFASGKPENKFFKMLSEVFGG